VRARHSLLRDVCGREHELVLMTMDESGDDLAPQVVARFNVSDCFQLQARTNDSADGDSASSWSILQRDATFGAGWPSAFYARISEGAEPLFAVSPPPLATRMHFIMEGIFAAVVVPEYAQLMGINFKLPADASADGSERSVDDYKYITVASSYAVRVVSSFAVPASPATTCPAPPSCSSTGVSAGTAQQTCQSTTSRAVATLITSDSYLQGALVLL
jgi:hypothetical protein